MFEYYLDVWRKYAVFSGRARRAEYWYFQLANFLIVCAWQMVMTFVAFSGGSAVALLLSFVYFVYMLAIFIPSLAAAVRRNHDSNKSGWWVLVPFYNLYLVIRPGTEGDNFYGPDPKRPVMDMPVPPPPPVADVPPAATV